MNKLCSEGVVMALRDASIKVLKGWAPLSHALYKKKKKQAVTSNIMSKCADREAGYI